jgi:hypothetical protein
MGTKQKTLKAIQLTVNLMSTNSPSSLGKCTSIDGILTHLALGTLLHTRISLTLFRIDSSSEIVVLNPELVKVYAAILIITIAIN